MLRRSPTFLRVSAFSLFMKDQAKAGALKSRGNPARSASKIYRKLTEAEKAALQKRAARVSYPALDAYNRFQRTYAPRFLHLTNRQRQREVAKLWAELKAKGTVKVPKAPKAPKSASSKVKAAAKAKKTKTTKKTSK